MNKVIVPVVIITMLLLSCSKKEEAPPEPGVVALVNGEKVTEKQVQEFISQYRQGMKQLLKGRVPADKKEDLRKQVIEHTINFMVVTQAAKKSNLTISEEEMNTYIEQMKKAPNFQEILKMRKLDEAGLREKLRDELVVMKYMQTKMPQDPDIPEEEIRAFYEEHKAEFKQHSKIRARHILIRVKPKAGKDAVEKARQKILNLYSRVKEGENFAVLAKKHSQDPGTAKKGGDLGYFKKGDLLPQFDRVAFNLPKNEVSPPVRTQLGFHLIKVTDKKAQTVQPLSEVKHQVKRLLAIKKGNEMMEQVVGDLRKNADIKVYEPEATP